MVHLIAMRESLIMLIISTNFDVSYMWKKTEQKEERSPARGSGRRN